MKIETKFSIGDKIFKAVKEDIYEVCDLCEGKGDVGALIKGQQLIVKCPKCGGLKKKHNTERNEWKVKMFYFNMSCKDKSNYVVVDSILIEEGKIIYLCNHDKYRRIHSVRVIESDLNMLFHTEEECQKFCDEKNSQE